MADRYFANDMPEFVEEASADEAKVGSFSKLLSLPYPTLSGMLRSSGLDLKQTVVMQTWGVSGKRVEDYTMYAGALGTAWLAFKAYQVTNNHTDLKLCSDIVKACDIASRDSGYVSFICGRAGVCALGAVVAKHAGDEMLLGHYLSKFKEIKLSSNLPNELLYGRAGYLWACSFLNKNVGNGTISTTRIRSVVDEIIKDGRQLAKKGRSSLMYEWHGKKYWGAAHGLAGIMYVLMTVQLKREEVEDVKGTLRYMIKNRFPSGNFLSSEGSESDRLVHWCHGAPGVALTLVRAAEVFGDEEFVQAAIDAGEVVWRRGLLKRVGLCHGISGNTYVFLSLYRLTGKVEYLYRAKAFACFLYDKGLKLISEGRMHGGDRPYSLFEGVGGMAHLFLDMTEPSEARFPGYEL
ncbi:putative lanthionine synthetase C [Rosa chinensis]|uniref:Putative lanthionine synthetase C n=1 Tax=Rosa chinensis TaxID=74649 RepID=A0A2P6QAZ3_ROSCH|nr:lanC-like protein GCL2 [Rosa chinensis]PRQ31358.1 putative lanthionine synthetase C [Rosa chinensis]